MIEKIKNLFKIKSKPKFVPFSKINFRFFEGKSDWIQARVEAYDAAFYSSNELRNNILDCAKVDEEDLINRYLTPGRNLSPKDLDALRTIGVFTAEEVREIVNIGYKDFYYG